MTENSYSFEKKFNLKAQAPLIHFQSEQNGATLRASEVKPKLDKFIIDKTGGFETVLNEHENWLMGYPQKNKKDYKPALNYQMNIVAEKTNIEEPPRFGIYYGNMGISDEAKKAKFVTGDCTLTVKCFISELQSILTKNLREFFVTTNFGRMNDKGFGSFVLQGEYSHEYVGKALCNRYGASDYYWFEKTKSDVFEDIKLLYSIMKSGYNNRDYYRSALFEYFHTKEIGNEKAYLKKVKMSPYLDGKPLERPGANRKHMEIKPDTCKYVRALLGIGDKIEYITGFDGTRPAKAKLRIKIKSNDDTIERLPSPIFFKVIGNKVYFVAQRINNIILGKKFTFSIEGNNPTLFNSIEVNPKDTATLTTPTEFDIDEFLAYFYNEYRNKFNMNKFKVKDEEK